MLTIHTVERPCSIAFQSFGETEVKNLHCVVARHLHIRRLQIPVHDPALMRVFERIATTCTSKKPSTLSPRAQPRGCYPLSKPTVKTVMSSSWPKLWAACAISLAESKTRLESRSKP